MSNKNSPGRRSMGHNPFSNVKLEGPKKHHDDHGPCASVPGKEAKANGGEHWERQYNPDAHDSNSPADAFNPRVASERPCTHVKVNKEDH